MHHQSEDRERCEVTVADGVELFSQLRDETVDFLTHHCLRIDMCFRFATWKILFGGHGYFQELASHFPDLFYSFSSDGSLFVRSIASAINRTKSGEYAVVSPLLGILSGNSFYRATLEDGSSLPSEICDELLGVLTQVTVRVPWRPDTFLLVDNARVMCGHDALCDKRIVTRYAMPTPHRSLKSWHLH